MSHYNVRKKAGQVEATMDDPNQASRLASITTYLLAAGVSRMGVFKFSQVPILPKSHVSWHLWSRRSGRNQ